MTLSIKSICGTINEPPIISEFKSIGEPTQDSISISYKVTDADLQIVRHYITVKTSTGVIFNKKEITKEVGYENPNNVFSYTINGLTRGTNYTIQIEIFDGLDLTKSDALSISTRNAIIHGVRVMTNNSNPQTAITYIEDSVGISPATKTSLGGWANEWPFNKVKMVGFKNGRETGNINPQNKKFYFGGAPVPRDVDVMTAIPKFYWKVSEIENGYEIRISDVKLDGFDCYAHKIMGVEKDFIYDASYLRSKGSNGKYRSKSGETPLTKLQLTSISATRSEIQSIGNGYQMHAYFLHKAELILFLLSYKTFYSQRALGLGVCEGSSPVRTGGTDTKGLIWGSTSKREQVCFLGIEDFFGNLNQLIDGFVINSKKEFLILTNNSNFDPRRGFYEKLFLYSGSNKMQGYISGVSQTDKGLFLPTKVAGSYTTFYTDFCNLTFENFAGDTHDTWLYSASGGAYDFGEKAGAFALDFDMHEFMLCENTGFRICYL